MNKSPLKMKYAFLFLAIIYSSSVFSQKISLQGVTIGEKYDKEDFYPSVAGYSGSILIWKIPDGRVSELMFTGLLEGGSWYYFTENEILDFKAKVEDFYQIKFDNKSGHYVEAEKDDCTFSLRISAPNSPSFYSLEFRIINRKLEQLGEEQKKENSKRDF